MKYDKISIKIFKFFLFSVQVDYSDVYYIVNYTKIYSVKKSMISNRNAHVDNNLKNVSSGSLIFCDWVYFCIDIDFPSYRSKNQRCLSQLHRLMLYIYSYISKPHPKFQNNIGRQSCVVSLRILIVPFLILKKVLPQKVHQRTGVINNYHIRL